MDEIANRSIDYSMYVAFHVSYGHMDVTMPWVNMCEYGDTYFKPHPEISERHHPFPQFNSSRGLANLSCSRHVSIAIFINTHSSEPWGYCC